MLVNPTPRCKEQINYACVRSIVVSGDCTSDLDVTMFMSLEWFILRRRTSLRDLDEVEKVIQLIPPNSSVPTTCSK